MTMTWVCRHNTDQITQPDVRRPCPRLPGRDRGAAPGLGAGSRRAFPAGHRPTARPMGARGYRRAGSPSCVSPPAASAPSVPPCSGCVECSPVRKRLPSNAPWMLALSALALGNSFPLIPCSAAITGCTLHRQLTSPDGVTDAGVAGAALSVLAFTPSPLWQRVRLLPSWQVVKPVLAPACVVCSVLFALLVVSSLTGTDQGLAERALVTSCLVWVGSTGRYSAPRIPQASSAGAVSRGSTSGPRLVTAA
jgi:hypothetical protein